MPVIDMSQEQILAKVLDCLRKASPKDLSIEEIAGLARVNRNTAAKYIFALEAQGKIIMTRQLGRAKLYTIKEKRP
jgi:DNA-binding IclR family transcriptional regulator